MVDTARFHLYKPDESEHVDVDLHLNANYDKLDAAAKKTELDAQVTNLTNAIADNTQAIKDLNSAVFGTQTRTVIPAAKMIKQGNQTINNNTTNKVVFSDGSQAIESIPGMCNPGIDAIKIIQPGYYLVLAQYTYTGNITGTMRTQIRLAGSNIIGSHKTTGDGAGSGSTDSPGQAAFWGFLSADDLISMWCWHLSGANQVLGQNGAGTWLSAIYTGKN